MKIGIDIDDVLCRSMDYFLYEFNKKHKTCLRKEDIRENSFNFTNDYNEEYLKWQQAIHVHNSLLFYDIMENCKEVLSKFNDKHELCIISSRKIALQEKTLKWLEYHFGENFFYKTIFYNVRRENKPKSEVCEEENIHILIDDNPYHATLSAKNNVKVFMMRQPWNETTEESKNLEKVDNWRDIEEKLINYIR